MIKIDRSRLPPPDEFIDWAAKEAERAQAFYWEATSPDETFDFKAYRDRQMRETLLELFHGKCAFCESLLQGTVSANIEHFRPKNMAVNIDGGVTKPGYWWLATEWANLYPICPVCNRTKGNRFPVSGPRARYLKLGSPLYEVRIPAGGAGEDDQPSQALVAMAVADQKKQLYALLDNGMLLAFDLERHSWSPRRIRRLGLGSEKYTSLVCDAKGEIFLAGASSGELILLSLYGSAANFKEYSGSSAVSAQQLAPDGSKAVVGFANGEVWVWDREKDTDVLLPGHTGQVNGVALTADGKRLVTIGQDSRLKVWDLEATPHVVFERSSDDPWVGVAFTQDEKKAVTLGKGGILKVWDAVIWNALYYIENQGEAENFRSLTLSGDGRYAASLCGNRLHLCDLYLRREITPGEMFSGDTRLVHIERDARSVVRITAEEYITAYSLNNLAAENALLLDPCQEDPETFLIFREDGLVASVPPEDGIDLPLIPDSIASRLNRGQVTIDVFGLNRAELVKERLVIVDRLKSEMAFRLKSPQYGVMESNEFQTWLQDQLGDHQPFAALRRQILGPMVKQAMPTADLPFEQSLRSKVEQSAAQQTLYESRKDLQAEQQQKHASFSVESTTAEEGEEEQFFIRSGLVDEIHVANYRPIANIHFKFGPGSSELAGWKVLVGENAVGKSSLLEAVGLALMGPDRYAKFIDAEKVDPSTFLRRGAKPKNSFIKVYFSGDPNPVEVKITAEGLEYVDPKFKPRGYLLGFGSARWLPKPGADPLETDPYVRIRNLFNPFVPLTDAIEWLKVQYKELSETMYGRVEGVLARLLLKKPGTRFRPYKGAVYIVPPGRRVSSRWDRLDELSDGYQTILAIAAAIMQMLGGRWKYQMQVAEGLVLLDEIGEHLHPTWKLRIVDSLRAAFPRMQFLATTHEPLCLRGLYDNEILIMRRVEDRIVFFDDIPSPDKLTIDQLLTSPYFGMLNTFDNATHKEFRRYYEILSKDESIRSPEEKTELEELHRKLDAEGLSGATLSEKLAIQATDQLLAEKRDAGQSFAPPELTPEIKNRVSKLLDKISSKVE